ncbi:translation initiation factor 4E [Acrasis kona]|uniref:Translation initiation factor 4E n=1 Tax=Acrasis kona TaxID=1008807 RepID=A0AAW2Z0V4_9EUKA
MSEPQEDTIQDAPQGDSWTTVPATKRKYTPRKFADQKTSTPTTPVSANTQPNVSIFDNTVSKKKQSLHTAYSFWFFRKERGGSEEYEENMKKIGDFETVDGFWGFYSHLVRPNDMPLPSDYHLFRKGIKPMWEDENNLKGGKWMIRLKKEYTPRLWEDLLLAVVGDQFDVGDELCGVVLSLRDHDIISVWNRTADNEKVRLKIRNTLIYLLDLPVGTKMDYRAHEASLQTGQPAGIPPKFTSETYVVKPRTSTTQGEEGAEQQEEEEVEAETTKDE